MVDARRVVAALGVTLVGLVVAAAGEAHEPPAKTDTRRRLRRAARQVKGARAERRAGLRTYGEILEHFLVWPGLAKFLDMFAHGESRWSPGAGRSKLGTNAALGAYQTRPTSAFVRREFKWKIPAIPDGLTKKQRRRFVRRQHAKRAVQHSRALMNAAVATAAIVSYIARLHGGRTRNATWLDVDVAGAYPIFVHGRPTFLPSSARIRKKFPTLEAWQQRYDEARARTLGSQRAVGLPREFLDEPAFPKGFGPGWRTTSVPGRPRKSVRTLIAMLGAFAQLAGLLDDA